MKIKIAFEFINKENQRVQIDKEFKFIKDADSFESIMDEMTDLLILILKENTDMNFIRDTIHKRP